MSIYFILDNVNNTYYSFDSTSRIEKRQSGTATSFPIETGLQVSDNYVNNNTTITFSGVITDVKTPTRASDNRLNKNTGDFIEGLEKLKRSGTPFTVSMGGNVEFLKNCVFESLDISQDRSKGSAGESNSYYVTFTAKQLRFAQKAESTVVRDVLIEATAADKKNKAGGKEEAPKLVVLGNTIYTEDQVEKIKNYEKPPENTKPLFIRIEEVISAWEFKPVVKLETTTL